MLALKPCCEERLPAPQTSTSASPPVAAASLLRLVGSVPPARKETLHQQLVLYVRAAGVSDERLLHVCMSQYIYGRLLLTMRHYVSWYRLSRQNRILELYKGC